MKLIKTDGGSGSDFGLIGRGIHINGDITFNNQINVEGKVTGKLVSESGTLTIGETGHLEAQVQVGVCVIHGTLVGDLVAKSRVEIRRTGRVQGNVIAPVLLVEEGAVFNGTIRMDQQVEGRKFTDNKTEVVDTSGHTDEQRKFKKA